MVFHDMKQVQYVRRPTGLTFYNFLIQGCLFCLFTDYGERSCEPKLFYHTDLDLDNYSINRLCLSYNISMYGGFDCCICMISVVHEFFVANSPLFCRTHWSISILGLDLASKLSSVLVRSLTTHRTPLFILCCEMCLAYKWGACQAYKLGSVDIVNAFCFIRSMMLVQSEVL